MKGSALDGKVKQWVGWMGRSGTGLEAIARSVQGRCSSAHGPVWGSQPLDQQHPPVQGLAAQRWAVAIKLDR